MRIVALALITTYGVPIVFMRGEAMVRLADLEKWERDHLLVKDALPLGPPVHKKLSKPLRETRLALISTAGLHDRDDAVFALADATYRVIEGDKEADELMLSHSSSNFDRAGFQEDVNLVFPIDRMRELEAQGKIGSLASMHFSFMGAGLLPEAYEKTVRDMARLLRRDGVDAVFILPVCPNCTRASAAIAYYLESEGIASTGISLVREITEAMKPPRMLWTSFPFGYPLGKPGDSAFQHQVIEAALALLQRDDLPVLEDFPLDVPFTAEAPACAISLARPEIDVTSWRARLKNEILLMTPWYNRSMKRRGRTMVGVCDASIDEITERLADWLDAPDGDLPDLTWFKYAMEDVKAFYSEAMIAEPGDYPPGYIMARFWNETAFGAALKQYHAHFDAHDELRPFARVIAPREAVQGSTGHYAIADNGEMIVQTGKRQSQKQGASHDG